MKLMVKSEKHDCNQCGDYEYCAFQYDKCTGFIPGDNYVFDRLYEGENFNMKRLTELEWIKYEEDFLKKNTEYFHKKCEINRQERNGILGEKEAEKKQKELKEEYKGYTDIYSSEGYCIVSDSLELAYKALGQDVTENFKSFLAQQKSIEENI